VLVHAPPFRESCLHEGEISNDDYLLFFASKIKGDVLLEAAKANPEIDFLVLCGHTHSSKSVKVMQKIGLRHNENDDFDHPKLDDTSPLKRHVLYRLNRQEYLQGESP
jgi:hypothetical protein